MNICPCAAEKRRILGVHLPSCSRLAPTATGVAARYPRLRAAERRRRRSTTMPSPAKMSAARAAGLDDCAPAALQVQCTTLQSVFGSLQSRAGAEGETAGEPASGGSSPGPRSVPASGAGSAPASATGSVGFSGAGTHWPTSQTSPTGQAAPSQASMQVPATQRSPSAQATSAQSAAAHRPSSWQTSIGPQPASSHRGAQVPSTQTVHSPHGTSVHGSTQRPALHVKSAGQVTPSQASTQEVDPSPSRQRSPAAHWASSQPAATQRPSSPQTSPSGHESAAHGPTHAPRSQI